MTLYRKRGPALLMVLTVAGVALVTGCNRHGGRRPIQGEVTLDGKPAAGAVVSFQAAADSPGNSSGAVVDEQGRFSIPAAKGLTPGVYAVTIQYWKDTGDTSEDPCSGQQVRKTTLVEYAEQGNLQITVTANGPDRVSFPLTCAAK